MDDYTQLIEQFPELNMANYSDDEVSDLNAWGVKAANALEALQARVLELGDALAALEITKDGAYAERNRLVALLSKVFPSGKKKTVIEGWSEDWHGCVYIDLPTGQASWHYNDSQGWLFEHLPMYQGTWDGHTTEEKYERIAAFAALAQPVEQINTQLLDALKAVLSDPMGTGLVRRRAEEAIARAEAQPEPVSPLRREKVKEILRESGYNTASAQERADFINGIRHGEVAHGIIGAAAKGGDKC